MKTGIVSALTNIANGFASSYANAIQTMRGFTGTAQEDDEVKPMVNTAVSPEVAKALQQADPISNELDSSKLNIVA
ncbi:MAG: hypothetical protein RL518_2765 [Pseudomonadota bacterium]|jgi:hypothetical protein